MLRFRFQILLSFGLQLNSQTYCCSLPLCRAALPARRDSRSHHHFDNLRKDKPVKAPAKSLRQRMCENREPGQSAGEKYNFAEQAANRCARETLAPMSITYPATHATKG